MVLALTAVAATVGLVVIFLIVFPVLVNALLVYIAAQAIGERAENQEYAATHRVPGRES
jgi:phage shock protein PspC (stress-responsive transcriptional regulator)